MKKNLLKMKVVRAFAMLLVLLMFLVTTTFAENLYVRPEGGSYGTENGSDWSNAFDGFEDIVWGSGTGQLGAGDTLFISGGDYNVRLNIKGGGTQSSPLIIRKAATALHGTPVGWNSSFSGQVVIDNYPCINQSVSNLNYVEIDGAELNGIRLELPNGSGVFGVNLIKGISYWKFKNIEVAGPGGSDGYPFSGPVRGFYVFNNGGATPNHLEVSYCNLHGISVGLTLNCKNFTLEYTSIYDVKTIPPGTTHADMMYFHGKSDSTIIRYCRFYNYQAECIYWAGPDQQDVVGSKVYGNVFSDGNVGCLKVDLMKDYPTKGSVSDIEFYNNTMVNMQSGIATAGQVVSGYVKNNLFVNVKGNSFNDLVLSNNSFNLTTAIFNDPANGDYTLSKPIVTGENLGSEYSIDAAGDTRTNWSVGAYEYVSSDTTTPTPAPVITGITNQAETSFTLNWTGSSDPSAPVSYKVYNGTTLVGTTQSTSYNVTNLSCGQSYQMKVVACDAAPTPNCVENTIYAAFTSACPTPISWIEDFTLPDSTMFDNGETAWSLSVSDATKASVQSNKFRFANVVSGYPEIVLSTEVIDISSESSVNISFDLGSTTFLEASDYIKVYYKLNGGSETLIVNKTGSFTMYTETLNGLSGNTIQIIIREKTQGSFEEHYIDNIKVESNGLKTSQFILGTVEMTDESGLQVYPNPFDQTTNIQYRMTDSGFVSLKVYDVHGREVAMLVNEHQPVGSYRVQWSGSGLPEGVYLAKLTIQQGGKDVAGVPIILTEKILLTK